MPQNWPDNEERRGVPGESRNVQSPVQYGEEDFDCPLKQSQQFFVAVKRQGKELTCFRDVDNMLSLLKVLPKNGEMCPLAALERRPSTESRGAFQARVCAGNCDPNATKC